MSLTILTDLCLKAKLIISTKKTPFLKKTFFRDFYAQMILDLKNSCLYCT